MTAPDHAAILYAYLARITDADLAAILEARRAATHAAMNLGTSAQLAAQSAELAACERATARIISHDLSSLERIIGR